MVNTENIGLDSWEDGKRWLLSKCIFCKHFNGVKDGGCDAFPNGIPEKFIVSKQSFSTPETHSKIEPNQVGDYVYQLNFTK